jgi:hypothetical protein
VGRISLDPVNPRAYIGLQCIIIWLESSAGKLELLAVVVERALTTLAYVLGPGRQRPSGRGPGGGGTRARLPLLAPPARTLERRAANSHTARLTILLFTKIRRKAVLGNSLVSSTK